MNYPNIDLRTISRDDVKRIVEWIKDDEVAELWFGRYSYGDAAHLGYDPQKILTSSKEEWDRTFNDENPEPHRAFFSIYKYEDNNVIVISSQISPIFPFYQNQKIDYQVIKDYFYTRHLMQSKKTVYKNIHQIHQGSVLTYDCKKDLWKKAGIK